MSHETTPVPLRYTQEDLLNHIEAVFEDAVLLVDRKNQDYSGESSDPFRAFKRSEEITFIPAEVGILVRISDKLARLGSLLRKDAGELPAVSDEGVEDTILDAINYLAILHAYLTDKENGNVYSGSERS